MGMASGSMRHMHSKYEANGFDKPHIEVPRGIRKALQDAF